MTLRLLTYNVKLLPDAGRLLEGAWWEAWQTDAWRAQHIVDDLRAQQPRWDVVCLQEVFDEDMRELLVRGLSRKVQGKALYPSLVAQSDDGDVLHEDSGLFFASRMPLEEHRFEEFGDSEGNDAWADKGVLWTVLDTRTVLGGCKLIVLSTHMQAGKEPGVRRKQLAQIRRLLQKRLARLTDPRGYAVVICGDLNVTAEKLAADGTILAQGKEYPRLAAAFGEARDLFRTLHPAAHGATWDPPANKKMVRSKSPRKRLDYCFALDAIPHPDPARPKITLEKLTCTRAEVLPFATADGGNLSDHFGLGVELRASQAGAP